MTASNCIVDDVAAIERIDAVPRILEVVCRTTGMGFSAVARVTEDRWIACAVRDEIAFGLTPGGELPVESTICDEIRASGQLVVIDSVNDDPVFCRHRTPQMYGFQSYISVPITLRNGYFFGTLCAIDPRPARVSTPQIVHMFTLFAELIAFHLDARDRIGALETRVAERTASLRQLNAALERVREDERQRIARELHDELGQTLTALKFDLRTIRAVVDPPSELGNGLSATIDNMDDSLESALVGVERIVTELRPLVLDSLGCAAAVEWLVASFEQRTGVSARIQTDLKTDVPADIGTAMFRVLQEALTNVARHAEASSVDVQFVADAGDVLLRVSDNGRGMRRGAPDSLPGCGLRGMNERVRALGGSLTIDTPLGGGAELIARVPMRVEQNVTSRESTCEDRFAS